MRVLFLVYLLIALSACGLETVQTCTTVPINEHTVFNDRCPINEVNLGPDLTNPPGIICAELQTQCPNPSAE